MKVWGVIGWKNAGKTGLMERLVTEFTRRGQHATRFCTNCAMPKNPRLRI